MTNPFRKPKNPFRKSEGTITLGPLEVQGFTAPDALAREVAPIQAAWKIAQRESNEPAMARSQAAIAADRRHSASGIGTAFHLAADAGASVLLPGADDPRATAVRRIATIQGANTTDDSDAARSVRALTGWTLPRHAPRGLTVEERAQIARLQSIVDDPNVRGATERLNAYVVAGGNPNAPLFGTGALQDAFKAHANDPGPTVADALGASAATGAVGATVGLNTALPNAGAIERGMGVRQIGAELFKGAATEGATVAILAAAGGADPRQILEQGATQAGLGAAIRGLHGAGSIREAILRPRPTDVDLDILSGRQEFIPPEGRGRVLRDDTPPSVLSRDAQGREVLSDGRVISSAQDLAERYPESFEPRPVRIPTGLEAAEIRLRRQVEAPPVLNEAGVGSPRLLAGAAGGIGGAAYGATQGDTPEERAKNALLYGLGGLAAGVGAGYAAERIGARSGAVVEAEREAGKSLAQAGRVGTRFIDTTKPSPFRDAPPPLKLVGDATPAPGVHGPVEGTPYVNLSKFGMDRDATARLRVEAERIGREVQGSPRRVATWDEWRDTAASLGLGDVTRKDYRAMTVPDLLAIQNLVVTNTDRLIQLDTEARAPGVSESELARMNLETSALNSQNDLLLRKFIPARTEAGHTLNAFRIIASRNFEPTWWLAKAQDIKGAPLNDAELAQVRGLLHVQDREGLVQAIARLRQAPFGDKLATFWKASILSNPKTHLVNTLANATLGTMEVAADIPGALVDRMLSVATGRRSLSGPSLLQWSAAREGAVSGARDALSIVRGHMPSEELAKLDIPKETHFDTPIIEAASQTVFRLLGAADRIPRMAALRRSLANQAEVLAHTERLTGEAFTARVHDLIAHPTTEMSMQAVAESQQAVVQDETAVGKVLKGIGQAPIVGPYVMPFSRTPGAVATRTGEYTFALPYEVGNVVRLAAQGKLKDISIPEQRRIAKLSGRGTLGGVGLIALGAWLYRHGRLTSVPADWSHDRAQATTDAMRGVQGNSIRLDLAGHRLQFDVGRLSPAGNLLAIGAMAAKAAEDRDPETSPVGAGILGAATTVADQPFLQGLSNATDAIHDPGRSGSRFLSNTLRGFVPAAGLLGAVTRATDTTVRMPFPRTSSDTTIPQKVGGFLSDVGQQVAMQIPGLSRLFPARPSPLGGSSVRQGGALGAVSQVSPVAVTEERHDPVLDALGQYDVTVTGFSPKKGESSGDFQTRAHQAGQLRREELDATVNSQEWDADTSFDYRQEMLQQALRRAANRQAQLTRQGRASSNPFRP